MVTEEQGEIQMAAANVLWSPGAEVLGRDRHGGKRGRLGAESWKWACDC